MKFSCDSCSAQYMIADEKVGPRGVKVRCKKCSHVILVKRPPSEEALAEPVPAPPLAPTGDVGLDVELGQAFDAMLSERKVEPDQASRSDLSETQPVSQEELERLATGINPSEAPASTQSSVAVASDWYVAIHDQQVGPLVSLTVKAKWESGEIGPDSLVWCSGMVDWKPLSTVPELAEMLAPVPRADARPKVEPAVPFSPAPEPAPATSPVDSGWQPNAAGALAALANQEMASLAQPEIRNSALAGAKPNGKGSLLESMNLPDSGGIDPTGALPLRIKGIDTTGEADLKRTSSVARSAAELRVRRSATRTVVVAVVAFALITVAAVGSVFWYFDQKLSSSRSADTLAAASPRPAAAPPAVAPPSPSPTPAPEAAAPTPSAPAPPPASPATPPLAAAAPTGNQVTPPSEGTADEPAGKQKRVRSESGLKSSHRRAPKVAMGERVEPAAAPEPAPKKSSGDPLLDFAGSSDNDFEKEMGTSPGKKRSVYVPPAPGSDVPNEVSQAQIQEGVASKIAGLRDCLSKQEAADPAAHGVLKIRWVISADGNVNGVKTLTPEFANHPISKCLTGVVRTIRFPRSKTTGQEVIFPFKF